MRALPWNDYDAENATLTIRHSLSQMKAGVVLKAPKTNQMRTLPLSRMAIDALKAQRVQQAKERLAGQRISEHRGRGVHRRARSARHADGSVVRLRPHRARKAAISTTRLHDLRHTAATTLLLAGVDVRTTAGVLGHASPTITLSTYAHLSQRRSTMRSIVSAND